MNIMASSVAPASPRPRFRVLRALGRVLLWMILGILTLWALAALYVDVRIAWLRIPAVVLYVAVLIAIFWKVKAQRYRALLSLLAFCVVTVWWLSLKPTNQADWEENVSRTSSIEVNGDRVTIHNLRNCDYRTETDYSNCWSDRTVYLSQLRAVDLFFTTWGPKYIGHPILSFQFGDHDHICFSIEARYKLGQSYSAILGFFRQYELIFITADERDVIRLRTNFRKDEEVRMYRTTLSPETARTFFFVYADYLNQLKDHPEWYNALTKNCTTTLDRQLAADLSNPQPWNYQILLNGTLDHLLYSRGRLVTGGLPYHELWEREHINAAGRAADGSSDWSERIREGRIGF